MLQQTGVKSIQDAVVVLHKMSADEKTRELAEMREKALHIEATEKSYARAQGRAERDNEILANLKSLGVSDEQIKAILGK